MKSGENGLIGPGSNDYGRSEFYTPPSKSKAETTGMLGAIDPYRDNSKEIGGTAEITRRLGGCEILSYVGNSTQIQSLKRESDDEVFSIGDKFECTNFDGVVPHGVIRGFEYSVKNDTFFISHTWSGIGFSINGIKHRKPLVGDYCVGDTVSVVLQSHVIEDCVILKIHFDNKGIWYDLEVGAHCKVEEGVTKNRLYNVSASSIRV